MTTWWIVFERRKGSKCWTPTIGGLLAGTFAFWVSESDAKKEVATRINCYPRSEEWEHRIVKVEVSH